MKEDRSHRCGCCSNCYFLNRFCLSTLLPHKWQVLIQVTATGQPIVIGIMSKNQGCDNLNIPTTYTRYWTFFPYFFFLQNISLFDFFFCVAVWCPIIAGLDLPPESNRHQPLRQLFHLFQMNINQARKCDIENLILKWCHNTELYNCTRNKKNETKQN